MNEDDGYEFHPGALRDIAEIWEFIAEDSVPAAIRVSEEILDAVRKLSSFPHQGHLRSKLTKRPLRFQIVRDFLIAYAPEENPILVIAVVHGRRSPRTIAAILRERI
jgi:plasmid stabilization system protein ParE